MAIRVVQLGSSRAAGEGIRLGTVRRPPRGVPKAQHATRDYYDVWLPDIAPSAALVARQLGAADPAASWRTFERRYRAELKQPQAARLLQLLAAMSHHADFAIGCYCADEKHCHRSILTRVLAEQGARFV
jgi:uncharacterized protein YeaO (DUF488 family)